MAYGDTTLGADHRWPFNGDLLDAIGSLDLTGSGTGFVGSGITRDGSNALRTDGRDDLATATPDATTGASGFNRYAFQGWFRVTQIQGPPVCIYKQGGSTAGFALFMWAGNNVMLQVIDTAASTPILQFFSKIALRANRTYHFFVRYSGSGFSDEIEFYIDGVKQTATLTGSTAPGAASMTAHTGLIAFGENGSASTEVPVGSQAVLVKAPSTASGLSGGRGKEPTPRPSPKRRSTTTCSALERSRTSPSRPVLKPRCRSPWTLSPRRCAQTCPSRS
jgi:hypothetical protein